MHMMHGFDPFWSMFLMIVFWIGLISLGIYLLTNFINGGNKKTPLQIIKERLAKGEINESEYERIKSIVEQDGSNAQK